MNTTPVFLSYEQLNELFNGRESLINSNEKEGISDMRLPSFKDSTFGVFKDPNNFNQSFMVSQQSEANNNSNILDSSLCGKSDIQAGSSFLNINSQMVMGNAYIIIILLLVKREDYQRMRDAWIKQESSDLQKESKSFQKVKDLEDQMSLQRGIIKQIKILNEANSRLQNQLKDQRVREQKLIEENQIVHEDYIKAKMALQDAEKQIQQKANRNRTQQCTNKDETIQNQKVQIQELKKEIAELQDALQKSRLERTTDTQQHSTNSQGLEEYQNNKQQQCLTPTSNTIQRVKSTQFTTTNQFSSSAITYQKANINGNYMNQYNNIDLINSGNQAIQMKPNRIYNYDSRINYGPGHFRNLNQ